MLRQRYATYRKELRINVPIVIPWEERWIVLYPSNDIQDFTCQEHFRYSIKVISTKTFCYIKGIK